MEMAGGTKHQRRNASDEYEERWHECQRRREVARNTNDEYEEIDDAIDGDEEELTNRARLCAGERPPHI